MQFVTNGPDIPSALLQAHEEGRVVLFCGAGISYPAGLPGFEGLVDRIYKCADTTPSAFESEAYKRHQFDVTLDLLGQRLPGRRLAVRKALAEVLRPNLRRKGATATHEALLQLARTRKGETRLVTTNFDRIFERVIVRTRAKVRRYAAPMLPIPKECRWNGIVYLHGLLPNDPEPSELNRLVLTSGDFGLAYLTERWAARFVSELFRHYVVCFVGYGINDPVMRYMMDALAADRMLGESTPDAYALVDYLPDKKDTRTDEWRTKGVVPILYEVADTQSNHSMLHDTIRAWAEVYRDGILGKERIIQELAMTRPSASTVQDDFVGRMLWALSDASGVPARRFAETDPAPSLDWLKVLSEEHFCHGDLDRFGVTLHALHDDGRRFSLLDRPSPYTLAPWMHLSSAEPAWSGLDLVMLNLARWLVRHLNNPELLLWFARNGGKAHSTFALLVEQELNRIEQLERDQKTDELESIRQRSPDAMPGPPMRKLWRLLFAGLVKSGSSDLDVFGWKKRLARDGLSASLRFELRELLAPRVALTPPHQWRREPAKEGSPERLHQLVDCKPEVATRYAYELLCDHERPEQWRAALPQLLDDLQQLLRDALDLLRELELANDDDDPSRWDLPSISQHWQNQRSHDWVVLVELLRDSWLAVREIESKRASQIAQSWITIPYLTFKRLALFAARHDNCISPDQWVSWLVADNAKWLWSINTKRETLRLLATQGKNLTLQDQVRLEAAILAGPPRAMFRDDILPKDWLEIWEHFVWLWLAKLHSSDLELGREAAERMGSLSTAHPDWRIAQNESDEFNQWISGTGMPDYADNLVIDVPPRKRAELVNWLKQARPSHQLFYRNTWEDNCRKHPFRSAVALRILAREGCWPVQPWKEALIAWSDKEKVSCSWRYLAPLLETTSGEFLESVAHEVSWWLEAVSKSIEGHEQVFFGLCRRVLDLPFQDDSASDDAVSKAINHPVGHVTQALLNLWYKRDLNDGDRLCAEHAAFFTPLCDASIPQYRHGRVLLAAQLISLFRVDQIWTENHLLPLFDWRHSIVEAYAAWSGFLWSPRLYRPLLIAMKAHLLETTRHYAHLGQQAEHFTTFFTHAALYPELYCTTEELRTAFAEIPSTSLDQSAQALLQALEGAGDQREDFWTNRIKPFWRGVWPKSLELVSNKIAEIFARLSIAARGRFPDALGTVRDWISKVEHPYYVIHVLHESKLPAQFPQDALILLDIIVRGQPFDARELSDCLSRIAKASPKLAGDDRYRRLQECARQRGT